LKKSINLYGESIIRTIAMERYNTGDYPIGLSLVKQFVHKVGIDSNAIDLFDGSGLSPQNRVTTSTLARLMQYARNQTYYKEFYNALPVIHDINMKSGSIHGVRAYTGYISSSDQNIYTFAIIANNYNCTGREMQEKLWRILDKLK
jgi:D-alanyl-D-alanine carboxypeptidase/D-alanyl-D-alanine-endopeptidase (penicillin-binding protein 4)